jgi:TP901 family phage tail tape measure protein
MADVNANIGVNIDTSDALNQLKNLQRQISAFHQSVAKSSSTAAVAQRDLQKNFVNGVNAIQGFSAELRTVRTSAESFTNSLEKNKFSIQQYFRYAASQSKTFGKNFTAEFSAIEKTAIERVKTLQTQYIKMGRDANGAMQAIAIRPTILDMKNLGTQTAVAAQKQVLFNQLVKQGSTNLLNFGKNTQWAGRQLMVGFTLPLATLGVTAGRVFMDMEKAAIKFKKVYGDLFTAPGETDKALDSIVELGVQYTKYGVAVSDALEVASDAAAAGFAGVDLQNQTTAALKLSVLGQMELQKALETTIALQNAFNISSKDLAGEIDFLNAVENQTVVSLDDITEAVPRVAPVIQSLGGDVRDLAFFLAAMKEGGVNAAQGANALKSGLASLINPTAAATQFLGQLGIDIQGIVGRNKGDISATVVELAKALDTLDPQRRAQAIEQLFGKFQFARMSALFANVAKDGTQASRVLDLAGSSLSDLASLSEKELGVSAASAMNKFRASIEQLKVALAPLGELFLKIATPFIDFATKVLEAFNNLPDGMKQAIGTVVTVVGGLGPILLMTFGLINNGIANMIKFFATVRLGYLKMTGQAKGIGDETQYMTQEQLEAAAAAASLDQAHAGLTQRFTAEKTAVDALRVAYEQAAAAGARFATLNPGMMKPGSVAAPMRMAKGGVVTVGGRGNKDTEPALLTPGEAVIPAEMVKKYAPLIEGMIAGNIPGYAKGVMLGMPKSAKSVSKNRDAAEEVYQMFLKSSYAGTAPTNYGHQISPTTGHSFPIFGLGGVYQKGNKQVFVKPVLDETAANAEMRSTQISRMAHGLEAPEQRIVVIKDPMDVKGVRRFLALESDLDPKFVNNQPMGVFNEEQYFRQLVASLLRVDKDLSGSNVYGNVVADAGPSGVFSRASGLRNYENNLPSMEEQAIVNLLGIKGGAKRAFAESTLGLMAGLTPDQYKSKMLGEIQKVLPRLKETISSFKLTNPTEVGVYDDMVRRLEQGLGVDWSKFHAIHSAVKPTKPKAGTQAAPLELANGIVSVPGPKGAGDVTPAMLSPGEAVIPTEMAKKYAPLIQAMIAGNIPGYKQGLFTQSSRFGQSGENFAQASHFDMFAPGEMSATLEELRGELADFTVDVYTLGDRLEDGTRELTKSTQNLSTLANTDRDIAAGGLTYSGTTTIEPRNRNQAYNVPVGDGGGVAAGSAFTLEGVVIAGQRAEAALIHGSESSVELAAELRELAQEGRIAQERLASSNSTQERLTFMQENTRKALEESYLSQTRVKTVEEAKNLAAQDLARVQREVAALIASGMDEEQAVQAAKNKLAATLIRSGNQEFVSGERGTSGGVLRDVATGRIRSLPANTERNLPKRKEVVRVGEVPEGERSLPRTGRTTANVASGFFTELQQKGQAAAEAAINAIVAGARRALGIASPAQELIDAGSNAGSSLVTGAREHIDDAKKAGENLGAATVEGAASATKKIRRASSDPETQADIDRRNQSRTQATQDSTNIAAGTPRKPRRVIREGDLETRQKDPAAQAAQEETNKNIQNTNKSFISLTDNISRVSIGLSAVTGVLSMFGGDMAGISSAVSMASGAIFALISITQALQGTFIAAAAAKRIEMVAGSMGAVANQAGVKTLSSLFVQGKGVAGLFANLGTALKAGLRFLGPIGIALSVLAIAIPFVVKAFQDNANKINGLGDAAFLTESKLNFLAEKFNVEAKKINWAERSAAARSTAGKSTEEKEEVVNLMIDPEFAKEFEVEIAGIAAATDEQAEQALKSLSTQLRNSGFEEDSVNAIISAIAAKAGKTDLELNFKPIFITDQSSADQAAGLADEAIADLNKKTESLFNVAALAGLSAGDIREDVSKELQAAGAAGASSIESLTLAFENGNISADIYNSSLSSLFNTLSSAEQPSWLLESMAEKLGLQDVITGLTNAADKSLALQAAIAGVDATEDLEILREASKESNKDNEDLQRDAEAARKRIVAGINAQTKAQEAQNYEKALSNALDEDSLESETLEKSIAAHHALVAAGMDAALAYKISGDAAQVAAMQKAMDMDATNGNTAAMDAFIASAQRLEGLTQQREALNPVRSGGGGQKSAFQEAIDQLKEQQKEAKSSTMAYAKLRSAGFGVGEATGIAKDGILAAALASEKVGSKKWNELVVAIRAARAEEEAWLNSTPEGRAEHFADVYSKVMDVFSAQEAIIDMNNEAATATTRKLIDALEKQIEVYQRRSAELERDLSQIADKEDEINKKYDEKNKALETVKKLNQDIINQQKSQISIADALSQGDISAAAMAMEDSKAQFAASQGDATQRGLDASRQAELDSITQNGKTRAEIEAEIKRIKKEIETIEFGALQNAEDYLAIADEIAEAAKDNLEVQGLSKTEWENINTRIDASKANAALYDAEVAKALVNAQGLVGEWEKLNETYTTTHVINTINTSSGGGGGGGGGATADPLDPSVDTPTSQANRIRTALSNRATAGKVSSALAKAANATSGNADSREAKINNYLSKITKFQADAILREAGLLGGGGGGGYNTTGGGPIAVAAGGPISGPGTGTSDSIPAMLSNGEYVVKAAAAKKLGRGFLDSVNAGRPRPIPGMAKPSFSLPNMQIPTRTMPDIPSGPSFKMPSDPGISTRPMTSPNKEPVANNNSSVYNYSLSVNVSGTNSSANDIANAVMNKIKTIESQQVKRQVLR